MKIFFNFCIITFLLLLCNAEIFHSYKNVVNLYWNSDTLEYIIIRDNQNWFESGPFFIHFNQTFYSSAPEQETMPMSQLHLIEQYF